MITCETRINKYLLKESIQMVESNQVAKIRKPAPDFEAMAWWNGFKKVKLSSFKGKLEKEIQQNDVSK